MSFQVGLPLSISIHDVFHVDRYKPFNTFPEYLCRQSEPPLEPEVIDGEVKCEVEATLARKMRRRKMDFLVKWFGYDEASDSTWEPFERLTHCRDITHRYCQEHDLLMCDRNVVNHTQHSFDILVYPMPLTPVP